jgi:transcriptional regulator with XRE-family HTH domain
MNVDLLTLGENIRKIRQYRNYSQEVLAEVCDLHRTYISDVERGSRNVTVGSLLKLARGLSTTVSELTRNVGLGDSLPLALDLRASVVGRNTKKEKGRAPAASLIAVNRPQAFPLAKS